VSIIQSFSNWHISCVLLYWHFSPVAFTLSFDILLPNRTDNSHLTCSKRLKTTPLNTGRLQLLVQCIQRQFVFSFYFRIVRFLL